MGARALFAGLLCFCAACHGGEIAVVTGANNPVTSLSAEEVSNLYLGRRGAAGDRARPQLLDHPRDSEARARFFRLLNGMDLRRVNAYWARLQFSGEQKPPLVVADSPTVVEFVRRNPGAIGYVEGVPDESGVRVLLVLRE